MDRVRTLSAFSLLCVVLAFYGTADQLLKVDNVRKIRRLEVHPEDRYGSWVCLILHNHVSYVNAFGSTFDDEWECIPRGMNDTSFLIQNLPESFFQQYLAELQQGSFEVEIEKAELHQENKTLQVKSGSNIGVLGHRRLQNSMERAIGRKRMLALTISTADSNATRSAEELYPFLFSDDEGSVASQMTACSAGKFELQPIFGGTIDIKISGKNEDYKGSLPAVHEAMTMLRDQLGIPNPAIYIDHLLFCLPPGLTKFAASAVTNHYRSIYNGANCARLSIVMHEIG